MVFVHAVFNTEASAARAVQELVNAEFSGNDISALMCNRDGVQELEVGHKTAMIPGAALGAVFGAIGGALAVSGGLVLAGPVFLALEGMMAGGALGTLAGTLGGLGFWREEIAFPTAAFENGAVLLGVCVGDSRIEDASKALKRAGAQEIRISSQQEARQKAQERHSQAPRI
ncbi:MAG TPA: hypothetical protein VJV78_10480 [Polyangiales bacterium]|nr:hypothetical protein [Polyangiales bacterium]